MPIAAATGAAGNTTALVGTPEQVAESLLDYYDAGATTLTALAQTRTVAALLERP
jgi:alkanesulfonate monooxygenase SsuD/methylene tetrahydromethanopterin reductase-like flavin-dependent oxidoreductase (luciferase family)